MTIFQPFDPFAFAFTYQQDAYVLLSNRPVTFAPLPYPSSKKPLSLITDERGSAQRRTIQEDCLHLALQTYCLFTEDLLNNLIPAFRALFAERATAPFFAVRTFCVALWCLDEHWDYSLFTLFMLIMFERTVVWQRVQTLTELCSMSIEPYPRQRYHVGKWVVSDG